MMRNILLVMFAASAAVATPAQAQSTDVRTDIRTDVRTNNGVVRERIEETHCRNGYCERYVSSQKYREGRDRRWRNEDRRWREYNRRRDRYDD